MKLTNNLLLLKIMRFKIIMMKINLLKLIKTLFYKKIELHIRIIKIMIIQI